MSISKLSFNTRTLFSKAKVGNETLNHYWNPKRKHDTTQWKDKI